MLLLLGLPAVFRPGFIRFEGLESWGSTFIREFGPKPVQLGKFCPSLLEIVRQILDTRRVSRRIQI